MTPARIFVNGCFDVIHAGHVRLLRHAGSLGSLMVAINGDKSVRRMKGSDRPINRAHLRREVLLGVKGVDHVLVFDEDSPTALLEQLYLTGAGPDIVVKGMDYVNREMPEFDVVASNGGRFVFFDSELELSTSCTIVGMRIDDPDTSFIVVESRCLACSQENCLRRIPSCECDCHERGPCPAKYHAPDCDCEGAGGDR